MDFLYKKIMTWLFGAAIAHSDRIKVAVAGFLTTLVLNFLKGCAVCQPFLTPELMDWLNKAILTAVGLLIAALSHRDIAAPDESVAGEAVDLPPAPKTADGLPGDN